MNAAAAGSTVQLRDHRGQCVLLRGGMGGKYDTDAVARGQKERSRS